MKRLIFICLSLFLFFHYINKEENKTIQVSCRRQDGKIDCIELNEYLVGVLAGEMPASFELEALKAQAVAARTYVFSRDLQVDDSTLSQVYLDKDKRIEKWGNLFETYEEKLQKAIDQTNDEVLFYDGKYISALYFSSSNGKTENNEDYFSSSPLPYLRSVYSEYETPIIKEQWFSNDLFREKFGSTELTVLNYTQGGNVNEVQIGNQIISGRQLREQLGLASSSFSVLKDARGILITTYGSGHGVGMSQYGANGMAQNGYTYEEILLHYYQGACIKPYK